MQAFILKCRPRARFHFGGIAPDNNSWLNTAGGHLPSDTLFSAIANNLAEMYPERIEALLDYFKNGQIRVSSGFYCLDTGEKRVFFLPKPVHYAESVTENFKDFAKVQFVSQTVWKNGWRFTDRWPDECLLIQKGKAVLAKSDLPESFFWTEKQGEKVRRTQKEAETVAARIALFKMDDYPRVRIHDPRRTEGFYSLTASSIADNREWLPQSAVHMYFLLEKAADIPADDEKRLLAAIRLLPDKGIGGERSNGCGLFEQDSDFQHFGLENPPGFSGDQISLSLTLPKDKPEFSRFVKYQVESRGGRWYGTENSKGPKQFHYVRMISEGALLRGAVEGQIAKIGTDESHPVLRYGKALCLPAPISLSTVQPS